MLHSDSNRKGENVRFFFHQMTWRWFHWQGARTMSFRLRNVFTRLHFDRNAVHMTLYVSCSCHIQCVYVFFSPIWHLFLPVFSFSFARILFFCFAATFRIGIGFSSIQCIVFGLLHFLHVNLNLSNECEININIE